MSAYSRLLESALLPAYNLVRGRNYFRYRRLLEESQWWPAERLRELQLGELRKLLTHALATVPYYRGKYPGLRVEDIRSLDDYAKLPTLTRAEVNAHRAELCSTAYAGRLRPHATGGSSGVPTRFFITLDSFDWRTAATQRVYSWPGCFLGERTLYLWGAAIGTPTRFQDLKMRAFRTLRREFMFSTFSQSDQLWDRIYQAAQSIRPRFVVSYVSSMEQFARYLMANNRRLSGIKAVIAAAEPVFDHHRGLAEQGFAAPLYNTYGSREFMSIAGECPLHQGMHINAENILLETRLPAEEGPSEILITDLHNYGMPFLRYEIGDVGTLDDQPCECGRGLPRLRSVEGRLLDMLRTPSGRQVPGEFFPHLMKDILEIREFQVEQKALDHIVVQAVLSRPLAPASRELLNSEIARVFGSATRVEVQPVHTIPLRPSGKRRVTVGLAETSR